MHVDGFGAVERRQPHGLRDLRAEHVGTSCPQFLRLIHQPERLPGSGRIHSDVHTCGKSAHHPAMGVERLLDPVGR